MDSFIKWVGGKKLLREQIIKEFPPEMDRYIEVFGGGGWVLFARDKHAKFEVFNDIDSELINLYRCIKYHGSELKRELNLILHSREVFYNTKNSLDMPGLTDIQRAAKYFVLISSSFSGKRESYATGVVDLTKKIARFDEITGRLSRVIIENRDFEQI